MCSGVAEPPERIQGRLGDSDLAGRGTRRHSGPRSNGAVSSRTTSMSGEPQQDADTSTSQAQIETIDCQRRDTVLHPEDCQAGLTLHRNTTHGYRRVGQSGTRGGRRDRAPRIWDKLGDALSDRIEIRSVAVTGLFVLAVFYTLYFARAVLAADRSRGPSRFSAEPGYPLSSSGCACPSR